MITTEAAVRLIPIPPALVDKRNTGMPLSSVNSSTRDCRTSTGVLPVKTRKGMEASFRIAWSISRIWVNYYDGSAPVLDRKCFWDLRKYQNFPLFLQVILE